MVECLGFPQWSPSIQYCLWHSEWVRILLPCTWLYFRQWLEDTVGLIYCTHCLRKEDDHSLQLNFIWCYETRLVNNGYTKFMSNVYDRIISIFLLEFISVIISYAKALRVKTKELTDNPHPLLLPWYNTFHCYCPGAITWELFVELNTLVSSLTREMHLDPSCVPSSLIHC